MALNWNQEITLDTVKNVVKRKKGGEGTTASLPSKTVMNLYQVDQRGTRLSTIVLVGVLGLVLIVAGLKFGVFDQFSFVAGKEAELAAQQQILLEASSGSSRLVEVTKLYEAYQTALGESDINVTSVLDLVEDQVKPTAQVSVITWSGKTLTLTLNNVSLETVGVLARQLESQAMVSTVNVSTAATQNDDKLTTATLVITFVDEE